MTRKTFLASLLACLFTPSLLTKLKKPTPVKIMGVDKEFGLGFQVSKTMIEDDHYGNKMGIQSSFNQLLRPGLRKDFTDLYEMGDGEYITYRD